MYILLSLTRFLILISNFLFLLLIFDCIQFTALSAATLSDFHSFSSQLLRCLKAEVLVHGNASEEEAKRLTASVREILQFLPLPPSQEPIRRSVALVPVPTNPNQS